MLAGGRLEGVGVAVQFLLAVRQMHQGHHGEHHPLVAGGEVVQHLPRLFPLLLQVVGHHGGEVIVAVLPPLPVGDVGLHPQQTRLHLPHRLVCGDGDHVDGQHHGAVQGRQFADHGVLNIRGVLLEKQHPPELAAHDEMVFLELQAVRADGILEGVPLPHTVPQIQSILGLLPGAVEVVEHPQAVHRAQLLTVGVQMIQA